MKRTASWVLFIGLLLFTAAFVLSTASSLPERVAAHFDGRGMANGFMLRTHYVVFVLALAIALPLAVVIFLTRIYRRAAHLINVPNRNYWLAPERQDKTVAFLTVHAVWFASLLAAFGCFIHWLVLDANTAQPPQLSNSVLFWSAAAFLGGLALWVVVLLLVFWRRPD